MITLKISDPDIHAYFEQILAFGHFDRSLRASLLISDLDDFKTSEEYSRVLVVGPADELDHVPSANRIILPLRAGSILNKITSALYSQIPDFPDKLYIGVFLFLPSQMLLQNEQSGEEIRLTEKERDLLLFLYSKSGQSASRQDILKSLWGYVDGVETHTVETHFYRLRQKMEKDPANPVLLVTQDDGYRLNI